MFFKCNDTNQEINFEIPTGYKNIALNLSGGADSSLLLYLTVKYLQENNRSEELLILTGADNYYSIDSQTSANVIHFVKEHLGGNCIKNHYIHYYYHNNKTDGIHEIEWDLVAKKELDLIITGTTLDAESEMLLDGDGNQILFKSMITEGRINRIEEEPIFLPAAGRHAANYRPLRNVNKKMSYAIYKQLGLLDSLFPITRSCNAIVSKGQINSYSEVCKKCLPCMERKWAFGEW